MSLLDEVFARALALGFDVASIVPVGPPRHGSAFADWLAAGYNGEMAYLAARAAERLDPTVWLPDARSLILLAANYNPGAPPPAWRDQAHGRIARYAWTADYHDVLKPRLYALDAFIRERTGRTALGKACVDTAPLLERDFAEQAGLGFIGRNTCLITPGLGSWTFLAALAVPEELTTDERRTTTANKTVVVRPSSVVAGCGRCTRCLDACPTNAFVAPTATPVGPHILDARRCISYLTIELRGPIPRDLRPLMGNWVFGCDVCQEVCPYNRAVPHVNDASVLSGARRTRRVASSDLHPAPCEVEGAAILGAAPPLLELLALDETAFRTRFRGTAVLRAKRRGLVRNACIAAGNWGDPAAIPTLSHLLADAEPLIRGHAAWALGQIGGAAGTSALRDALGVESDAWVREEIGSALAR
jgi:epoxyqueuosine reductase